MKRYTSSRMLTHEGVHDPLSLCKQGDRYAAYLHDAVIVYAIALTETIRKGENVDSGTVIARNCRGKMFRGTSKPMFSNHF